MPKLSQKSYHAAAPSLMRLLYKLVVSKTKMCFV